MAQRTKLFQNAGSPLIQGYSRSRKPFWREWLSSVAATTLACGAIRAVVVLTGPGVVSNASWESVTSAALLGLWVGLVACAIVVWAARAMGARRSWLAGAVVSTCVALLVWVAWPAVR